MELNLGMKTLYIIRHAKSSWEDPDLDDEDRPLNDRGKRDAPRMGKRLKEKEITPDVMISSPAKRAFSTARRIGEVLGYKKKNIVKEKKLYHASDDDMLKVVQGISDKHNIVIIFGHNPGLTDFANSLRDDEHEIHNIPTCGIISFRFNIKSWKDMTWGIGSMLFYDFPKSRED